MTSPLMRRVVVMIMLATSGCTLSPYHIPPDLVIDPARTPREKLVEETRKRSPLATRKPDPTSVTDAADVGGKEKRFVERFFLAYHESYDDEPSVEKARMFTRYGMTLMDTRCDLFFEQIGRGSQNGDFIRREFQSITGALIAALGLTNIGQDAITGVGIGSALGTQSIDNYTTVYFFSPDVGAVQQLVRRAFTSLRISLLSPEQSPKDFDSAVNALRVYQNVCTAHEIKRLVTEAINSGKTEVRSANGSTEQQNAWMNTALTELGTLFELVALTEREAALVDILVLNTPAKQDDVGVDFICEILSNKLRGVLCEATKHEVKDGKIDGFLAKKVSDALRTDIASRMAALRVAGASTYPTTRKEQVSIVESSGAEVRKRKIADVISNRRIAELDKKLDAFTAAALVNPENVKEKQELETERAEVVAGQKENLNQIKAEREVSKIAAESARAPQQAIGVSVVGSSSPPAATPRQ